MKKSIRALLFVISIVLGVVLYFDFKKKSERTVLKPTKEFYINDSANALLNSTKWYVYIVGKQFYEESLEDYLIPDDEYGIQIVLVTYFKDEEIDNTKIFNDYGVGKNDLGLMIFMAFDKTGDDYTFDSLTIEIGTKLATYLSAFEASQIVDEYFYGVGSSNNYDYRIFSLYYHLTRITANRVYGYSEGYIHNNYLNPIDYLDEQYSVTHKLESERFKFDTFQVVILIFLIITFFGSSGSYLIVNVLMNMGSSGSKGGGGGSSGYYFKK